MRISLMIERFNSYYPLLIIGAYAVWVITVCVLKCHYGICLDQSKLHDNLWGIFGLLVPMVMFLGNLFAFLIIWIFKYSQFKRMCFFGMLYSFLCFFLMYLFLAFNVSAQGYYAVPHEPTSITIHWYDEISRCSCHSVK